MKKFEEMVEIIHGFQLEGAEAQAEQKREEMVEAQNRVQILRQDDSAARKLAKQISDMAAQLKK